MHQNLSVLSLSSRSTFLKKIDLIIQATSFSILDVFNNFVLIPLTSSDNLIIAGNLADTADITPQNHSPGNRIRSVLSKTGLTKKDIAHLQSDLLSSKTIFIRS